MITIVNYGMGNLGSVQNMFKRIGVESCISSDITEIEKASKLLLPGVGSFDAAMNRINEGGFRAVLDKKALIEKVPVLGICLGMQLLTNSSEEGKEKGLGWIPAQTLAFKFTEAQNLKIPHMGWNIAHPASKSKLTENFVEESRFYFVHSYYVKVENEAHSILKTNYGSSFDSGIEKDNIFGAQFHPEKSHKFGMRFLESFAKI
ncbi:MAG: imidazole glycerol phosphate synthase subunit HisH [Bacteroidetes bacterium]|nr:imidazole glycerol phosphate synthase subunit HisH [Bacteroidota bacterium]MBK9670834.1 imidazole glycerol phosphate synthase subunit HisH [Bacteroidota bacterium]MBK9801170.1 imidazole glycerol phosphate synthase subunit HisH [Bacteroidota bacterium]MBP6411902.1 imidazole glycerol phosphate synthase subunit HisH [Bacteroidia bacterium]